MTDTPYTEGFTNGRAYELARIIKVIEDSVGSMTADVIIKLIKWRAEVSDTPAEKARKQRLLREITRLSEEAGLYEDEATPEEIVASIKEVRKEMAEERAKGEQK